MVICQRMFDGQGMLAFRKGTQSPKVLVLFSVMRFVYGWVNKISLETRPVLRLLPLFRYAYAVL